MSDRVSSQLERSSPAASGVVVRPQPVPSEPTVIQSMAEFIQHVVPQPSVSHSQHTQQVHWVNFQQCDLNDASGAADLRALIGDREASVVMVIGVAQGYAVWALFSNGDCELLMTDYNGPVTCVRLLPQPQKLTSVDMDSGQRQSAIRPVLCVVDGAAATGIKAACACSFLSLRHERISLATLRYEQPILDVQANAHAVVLLFAGTLSVVDPIDFHEMFSLQGAFSADKPSLPSACALNSTSLAFAASQLNTSWQSCGGVRAVSTNTYTSQVLSAAKNISKQMTAFGESVVSSLQHNQPTNQHALSHSPNQHKQGGLVTVIDLNTYSYTNSKEAQGVLAHFTAHSSEGLSCMAYSSACGLLVTSGIQQLVFSGDNRWLSACSNHGTTHIFPIMPYGGVANQRSHGTTVLHNKDSRFHKSAGLDVMEQSSASASWQHTHGQGAVASGGSPSTNQASPSQTAYKDCHPSVHAQHLSLARASLNPRIPSTQPPTHVWAISKIHQQLLAACTLSARATDLAPVTMSRSPQSQTQKAGLSARCVSRACFARPIGCEPNEANTANGQESVYLLNNQMQLTEYSLRVRARDEGTKSSAQSPIQLQLIPSAIWTLSTPVQSSSAVPLPVNHVLVRAAQIQADRQEHRQRVHSEACSLHKGKQRKQGVRLMRSTKDTTTDNDRHNSWIAQVEINTYSGPHRRLWMGPQFTFKTYADTDTAHAPQQLMSPNSTVPTRTHRMLVTGNFFASPDYGFGSATVTDCTSEPLAMPGRSVPVVIEASSAVSAVSMPYAAVSVVCGSWSDNDYISSHERQGVLRQNIADAMQDATLNLSGSRMNKSQAVLDETRSESSSEQSGDRRESCESLLLDMQ